ncbi:MAG: preprotein translocase subunit SecE [bacterium]|nr:preprotein translocase subunit SecE [bacterium]
MIEKTINFFKEVRLEMKKVNWPTKRETVKYTLIVVALTVVTAALLGGLDFIYNTLLNQII